MKAQTQEWLRRAEEDLGAAEVLMRESFLSAVMFHCQQAVEKILKALWTQTENSTPPRTHDLVYLGEHLNIPLSEGQFDFLRRLGEQYVPTRYPLESPGFPEETTVLYFEQTKEMFSWLQQRLS